MVLSSQRSEHPDDDAFQRWDMERLFRDLLAVKQQMRRKIKSLSAFEVDYLQLLLTGHKPADIAQKINWSINSLKVEASNGLYQYISMLTGKDIEDWRDIIIALEESGYKRRPKRIMVIVIDDTDELETNTIMQQIGQITGDRSFKLLKTEIGSLVLHLEGSEEGCNRLEALFHSGELSKLLGYPVRQVYYPAEVAEDTSPSIPTPPQRPTYVHLYQWFNHVVEAGWQTMQELFASGELSPAYAIRNSSTEGEVFLVNLAERDRQAEIATLVDQLYAAQPTIPRAEAASRLGRIGRDSMEAIAALIHLIRTSQDDQLRWIAAESLGMIDPDNVATGVRRVKDLSMLLTSHALALMVGILEKGDRGIAILVRVYPLRGQRYLPDDVVLRVLDGAEEVFLEARSRQIDDYIQLQFSGQPGEQFSLQVNLGDVGITEVFMI